MDQTAEAHRKVNGLERNNSGFSLIELLVVIALIGVMATIVIPNFFGAQQGYERKNFIGQLNTLLKSGQSHAITDHKLHQLFFDFKNKKIELRYQTDQKDKKGEIAYAKVPGMYAYTSMDIPDNIEIKNFYIDNSGFDEMSKFSGGKSGELWFYIVPEGLTQEAIINFVDTKDRLYSDKPRPTGLVLNPFTAQFKVYDAFQK